MKRYNKFLIVSTVALLLGGVYLYFSNSVKSDPIIPTAYGSSLASSASAEPLASSSSTEADKISDDISFLTTLVALKNIKIDTSIFTDKNFNALQNNSVKIEKVIPGRTNPFAPISTYSVSTSTPTVSKVVTDQPTQITSSTAVLNGTLNATGATEIHFEYGTSSELGIITPTVKQSLVGTFIKNITGLSPKTNYLYKSCAKINSTMLCGDVVSFTTN